MSETDAADGIKIAPAYRNKVFTVGYDDDASRLGNFTLSNTQILGVINPLDDGVVDASKAKVAKINAANNAYYDVEYSVRSGNTEIVKGSWTEVSTVKDIFSSSVKDVTIYVTFTYDKVGVDGQGPDEVDDRNQMTYNVHLETAIDSGLYSVATPYVTNKTDDLAKLVTNGDYVNLPGWEVPAYDAEGNEYYYQYTIDGDDIYGDYVKAGHSSFAKSTTNDKDTNGDGKVSCDEYYGTTGLVWSDEKNACVVESNGAVVVTIPNTATK